VKKKIFGYELIIDLFECDNETLSSKNKIKEYVETLCKLIKMKPYGKPLIPHFGHDKEFTAGYSLVQLIETSSITGHFSEHWNTVYINIFSCKKYDAKKAEKFTKEFFKAKRIKSKMLVR